MKVVGILGLIFVMAPIEAMNKSMVAAPMVIVSQKAESHSYSCTCFCRGCLKTATQRLKDLIIQANYICHSQKLKKQCSEVNVPTNEELIWVKSMKEEVKTLKGSLKEIKIPKVKTVSCTAAKNPNILADRKTPPLDITDGDEEITILTNPNQIQLRYYDPYGS